MIYLLFFILILFLLVAYLASGRDLVDPAVLFCASFLFSVAWAVVYAKQWELGLHANTFFVVAGGVGVFVLVSCVTAKFFAKRDRQINWSCATEPSPAFGESGATPLAPAASSGSCKATPIELQRWKLLLLVCFEVFAIAAYLIGIMRLLGAKTITEATYQIYIHINFSSEALYIPRIARIPRDIVNALGFWMAAVIGYNFAVTRRVRPLELVVFVFAVLNSMTSGGRTIVIIMVLVLILATFMISLMIKPHRVAVKPTSLLLVIGVAVLALAGFKGVADLLGRTTRGSAVDYLATYCGTQVKNLDLFLQGPRPTQRFTGGQTFIYLIRFFGERLGVPGAFYQLDNPFRSVGTFSLGNVYTTFYAFYYDFGYPGVFVLTAVMAAVTSAVHQLARRVRLDGRLHLIFVVDLYFMTTLVFSYFSNKFYEQIASPTFIKYVIFWICFDVFFFRIARRQRLGAGVDKPACI